MTTFLIVIGCMTGIGGLGWLLYRLGGGNIGLFLSDIIDAALDVFSDIDFTDFGD